MKSLVSKHNDIQQHISFRAVRGHVDKDILSFEDRSDDIDLAISQLRDGGYEITVPELMECSIDDLKSAGFRLWSEEEENGQVLMLIPVLLIPFLPEDLSIYQVASDMTSNETKNCVYKLGEVDTAEVGGCIAYGVWVDSEATTVMSVSDSAPDDWTRTILMTHMSENIKALKTAVNVCDTPELVHPLVNMRREFKSLLNKLENNSIDTDTCAIKYMELLGVNRKHQLLREQLISTQNALSTLCQKFLKDEHGVDIQNLIVNKKTAHGTYKGSPITINVRMYGGLIFGETYIGFYSDDIPELHMPVKLSVYEDGDVRTAYVNYTSAHDEWIYRNVTDEFESDSDDFDAEAEAEAFADFEHYMTNEQDDDEDRGQSL